MKRIIIYVITMFMIFLLFCSCENNNDSNIIPTEDQPSAVQTSTETPTEKQVKKGAQYGYDGDDHLEYVIYKYAVEEFGKRLDPNAILIPSVDIFSIEENDGQIKVSGFFMLNAYRPVGHYSLDMFYAYEYPAVMYLRRNGEKIPLDHIEMIEGADYFTSEAKELFKDDYERLMEKVLDYRYKLDLQVESLKRYLSLNDIEISKYSTYGSNFRNLYPSEDEPKELDLNALYGYDGTDPVEYAVNNYLVEVVGKKGCSIESKGSTIIPITYYMHKVQKDDETLVYGSFFVMSFKVDNDVISPYSGGERAGLLHIKEINGKYLVIQADWINSGEQFYEDAQKLFGENFNDFSKIFYDHKSKQEIRFDGIRKYIRMNDLSVTKFKNYGSDPIDLFND